MSFSVTFGARGTLSQAVENAGRNNHLRKVEGVRVEGSYSLFTEPSPNRA